MPDRPDIVVILTDQERAAPPYEGEALGRWRRDVLAGRRWFDENAVTFERHSVGSVACVPSRPTLLTGHYPDVHGVTQTDGMAKLAGDPRMRWLRPGEVPTLGNWLRAGGYDTHYDGKWHVSHAELTDPETGERLATNTAKGEVLPGAVKAYLDADPLAPFGFSGWVGPEPHGPAAADSGLVRDPLIAARVVAWLEDRYARRRAGDAAAKRPFLLVVSFVNPHDIVFFPAWVVRSPLGRSALDPPPVPPAPTQEQDLASQPAAQAAYRRAYAAAYGPGAVIERIYRWRAQAYRDLYYRLHAEVDGPIDRVRRAVTEGGSENAIVVRSSDHGEMLGAHGGLHQKWFNLYDETTRVPLQIAGIGPSRTRAAAIRSMPTSHVDLVPTLLSAAGLAEAAIAAELRRTFSEVHPLPGRDLMPLVRGGAPDPGRAVYMMTRDDVLDGPADASLMLRRIGAGGLSLPSRIQAPSHVGSGFEGLVARLGEEEARGGAGHLWKLVRSFDDPATWSEPGVRQRVGSGPGATFRVRPLADEWELYDLDADPAEARNRAREAAFAGVLERMRARLDAERARAVPARSRPWPYVSEVDVMSEKSSGVVVTRSRVVTGSIEEVWATLADYGAIHTWARGLDGSSLIGEGPVGLGTARRVKVGPLRLTEEVTRWAPPFELAYRIDGLPPIVRSVVNAWRLEAEGASTRATLTTTLDPRTFPGGRLLAELFGAQLAKTSAELLAGLADRHRK